ncbi:MAG TPA: hypothetical protein VEJ63_21370 [Planctomycetota bacterium]|nr:hypothetical protein [Planctomycetota bacterium]
MAETVAEKTATEEWGRDGPTTMAVIQAQLGRARSIWRWSETLSRGFLWALALVVAFLVFSLLDNLLHLPASVRLILSGATLLGSAGALCFWVLAPLFWKINDQAAAVYLERKLGERENLLINAVQLSGKLAAEAPAFSKSMVEHVVTRAASRTAELSLQALWEKRRLKKLGLALLGALLLSGLYIALLPQYAQNALLRFARPLAGIPALTNTKVFLFPNGDIDLLSGDKLTLFAAAAPDKGDAPEQAVLLAEVDGSVHRIPMSHATGKHPELEKQIGSAGASASFVYEFPSVSKSFVVYASAGDGESLPCRVRVRERPAAEDVEAEITPPTYTDMQPASEAIPSGIIHALPGSAVTLKFRPTLTLKKGTLTLPQGSVEASGAESAYSAKFTIEKEGPLTLALISSDGTEAPRALEGQILLRADALPTAAFENSSLNVAVRPGATVPLSVRAQDDFGLASLRLIVRRGEASDNITDEKAYTTIKGWTYDLPGHRSVTELYPVQVDPKKFLPGNTYAVFAEVTDFAPAADSKSKRVVRSAPLLLRVLSADQMELDPNSPFASVFQRIQELIDQQTKARGKTITVKEFLSDIFEKKMLGARLASIRDEQKKIQSAVDRLLADLRAAPQAQLKMASDKLTAELMEIAKGPLAQSVTALEKTDPAQRDKNVAALLVKAEEGLQTEVINRLTSLLGTLSQLEKKKDPARADLKDDQDNQRLKEKLQETKDKLDKFIDAQKQIIKTTEELEKKKPEDLTEEDQKILGDLAKDEMKWAEFFKEAFTDLSKVPNQDFSSSQLAQEFNEVFQEIRKASEALHQKNVEMAVRSEEGGLELAKQISTNLEKWLPDTRDTEKWNMEEPKGEFDVPLADLPRELEDIIGELIDEQEKMTEDVQDTSSSWMDSMDKGAGWDAADGNISNMSAKGVTGNRQPNDMEIAGRSGEGRSGKSTGQFAEETADGKGGKQTPTRATPDPFEQGAVKDQSKEAQGGSTGGGKEAGASSLGLRGQPPPSTMKKLDRIKENQAQIRQKAEKVVTQLKAYHLPSSDAEEAVRRMKQIESKLGEGKGFALKQAHVSVIDSLKEAKKVTGFQAEVNSERTRELPKNVRNKIMSGMQQPAPQGYQDLMEAYFKSLVEPDEK